MNNHTIQTIEELSDSSAHPLIQHGARYVQGFMSNSISMDMLRITRVVDTGTEGEFDWLVNNRRYRVRAGDFMLFSNSDLRMPLIKNKPSDVYIEFIRFSPVALFNGTELLKIYYNNHRTHHIPAEKAKLLLPSFERTIFECRQTDKYKNDAAAAALRLLLIDLIRVLPESPVSEQNSPNRTLLAHMQLIHEIVNYMREHMSDKLTIGEVAAKFGISESLLSKLFRSMLEMTFPEYLRRLRVNNVIRLVSSGSSGVLHAALESGFGSISGFYKSFSAITGTSPRDFMSSTKYLER